MTIRLTKADAQYKLHTNSVFLMCPRCGDVMYEPFVALSRVHPKVKICPDCGGDEAATQLADENAGWQPVTFEWTEMRERYDDRIVLLETDVEELNTEVEALETDLRQKRLQLRRNEDQLVKNREALRGFQEQITFMDEQIKNLLSQLLQTNEGGPLISWEKP